MTESERTVYLVELGCNHCEETTTFAAKGPAVGVDRDAPWPAVDHCPLCAASYPDDLGWVIQSVHEAEIDDEPELVTDGGTERPAGEFGSGVPDKLRKYSGMEYVCEHCGRVEEFDGLAIKIRSPIRKDADCTICRMHLVRREEYWNGEIEPDEVVSYV